MQFRLALLFLLCGLALIATTVCLHSPPLDDQKVPPNTTSPLSSALLTALTQMGDDTAPAAVLRRSASQWGGSHLEATEVAARAGYNRADELTAQPDMPNGVWATIAVAPSKFVDPGESLTVFGSWAVPTMPSRQNDSDAAVCNYVCLFDFGLQPSMAWHMADPLDPWIRHSDRHRRATNFFELSSKAEDIRRTTATWSDNGGRLVKCPAPTPPANVWNARVKSNEFTSALVSVQASCQGESESAQNAVAPTAAKIEYSRENHHLPSKSALDMAKIRQHRYPLNGSSDFLCACTMIRDDADRLREWIEYHSIIGVSRFFFYDNNSTDQTESTVRPYVEKGLAKLINWHFLSTTGSFGPQSQAFSHCLETFGGREAWDAQPTSDGNFTMTNSNRHHARAAALRLPQCEWIMFTDVDEYLVPKPFQAIQPEDESFVKYLQRSTCILNERGECLNQKGPSSIYLPSLLFGHSNHVSNPSGLRIRNFSLRWFSADTLGKSVAHRRTYPALQNIVHLFNWPPGESNTAKSSGTPVSGDFEMVFGEDFLYDPSGEHVISSRARNSQLEATVHHYATGSWDDFVKKWQKPRDRHGSCAINMTFAASFQESLTLFNQSSRWPTTGELIHSNFFGDCINEALDSRNQTFENTNFINASDTGDTLIGIQRYFDLLERNIARTNKVAPVT